VRALTVVPADRRGAHVFQHRGPYALAAAVVDHEAIVVDPALPPVAEQEVPICCGPIDEIRAQQLRRFQGRDPLQALELIRSGRYAHARARDAALAIVEEAVIVLQLWTWDNADGEAKRALISARRFWSGWRVEAPLRVLLANLGVGFLCGNREALPERQRTLPHALRGRAHAGEIIRVGPVVDAERPGRIRAHARAQRHIGLRTRRQALRPWQLRASHLASIRSALKLTAAGADRWSHILV
jgi:hypothetical protein